MTFEAPADEWAAALTALRNDTRFSSRFDEYARDLGWDLSALEARLTGPAKLRWDQLFTDSTDWRLTAGAEKLMGALLATRLKGFTPRHERVTGDLELREPRLVLGDLEVSGHLELKSDLFVFGNLTVGGLQRDTNSDYANVVVGGDLVCGAGLLSEGMLMVGGSLSAPLVALTFNQGFAKLLGGVKARLFFECDHGGTRVFGPLSASVIVFDELEADDELEVVGLEAVFEQLAPSVKAELGEVDDSMELATRLAELLAQGQKIFP